MERVVGGAHGDHKVEVVDVRRHVVLDVVQDRDHQVLKDGAVGVDFVGLDRKVGTHLEHRGGKLERLDPRLARHVGRLQQVVGRGERLGLPLFVGLGVLHGAGREIAQRRLLVGHVLQADAVLWARLDQLRVLGRQAVAAGVGGAVARQAQRPHHLFDLGQLARVGLLADVRRAFVGAAPTVVVFGAHANDVVGLLVFFAAPSERVSVVAGHLQRHHRLYRDERSRNLKDEARVGKGYFLATERVALALALVGPGVGVQVDPHGVFDRKDHRRVVAAHLELDAVPAVEVRRVVDAVGSLQVGVADADPARLRSDRSPALARAHDAGDGDRSMSALAAAILRLEAALLLVELSHELVESASERKVRRQDVEPHAQDLQLALSVLGGGRVDALAVKDDVREALKVDHLAAAAKLGQRPVGLDVPRQRAFVGVVDDTVLRVGDQIDERREQVVHRLGALVEQLPLAKARLVRVLKVGDRNVERHVRDGPGADVRRHADVVEQARLGILAPSPLRHRSVFVVGARQGPYAREEVAVGAGLQAGADALYAALLGLGLVRRQGRRRRRRAELAAPGSRLCHRSGPRNCGRIRPQSTF